MRSPSLSITRVEPEPAAAPIRAPAPAAAAAQAGTSSLLRLVLDYTGISLLIMLPLWRPGYVLTMDAVFVPHYRFAVAAVPHEQALSTLLAVLNLVLPGDVIEKLLFTAILVLAGLGMHRLVAVKNPTIRYVAGLAAVFNPFVYDRMMYGQWTVLLGYALLPWLLTSLKAAQAAPGVWPALRIAVWWTIVTVVSLPMGLIAATAIAIVLLCHGFLASGTSPRSTLRLAALIAGWWVLLNAYWVIAELLSPAASAARAAQFSPLELSAFATQGDPVWGSVLTVLGGYGFWAEGSTRFVDMREVLPYWPLEAVALPVLAALALGVSLRRRERSFTFALALLLLVATVLGIGLASPITGALTRFLYDHLALYRGLRDTQKWDALVLVAGITLAVQGLDIALGRLAAVRRRTATALTGACLLLPVLFAPALFWGFAGQLHPVEYPASWSSANERLGADPNHGVALFLPWHEYLRFPFTGRVIANPARSFFDVPVIQGDNMEMRLIRSDSANPESAAISRLFAAGDPARVAPALAKFHIKYILLEKTADWRAYRSLLAGPRLQRVGQWPDLVLYQNLAWRR